VYIFLFIYIIFFAYSTQQIYLTWKREDKLLLRSRFCRKYYTTKKWKHSVTKTENLFIYLPWKFLPYRKISFKFNIYIIHLYNIWRKHCLLRQQSGVVTLQNSAETCVHLRVQRPLLASGSNHNKIIRYIKYPVGTFKVFFFRIVTCKLSVRRTDGQTWSI